MTDIATLGVVVDPTGARIGTAIADREFDKLARSAKKAANASEKSFLSLGAVLKKVGGLAAAVGASFAAADIVRTGAEFQQQIADLSAIVGATGDDLDALAESARNLGATTAFSASQAAQAFQLIASAKPELLETSGALEEVTRSALTLAQAAGVELPQAADLLTTALNQFGEPASEAGRFINVLAAGAKEGASEIPDTAAAIINAGVAARSANISFEDLNAALQTLAREGIRGSEAGTPLRNIFLKLQTEADKFNPKIVGLSQALRNLGDAGLTAEEKLKIFRLENINAAEILIRNVDVFDDFKEAITGTNVAFDQAATRTDTLSGDFRQFLSAIEEIQLVLFDLFEPALRAVVQTLTEWARAFGNAIQQVRGFSIFVVGEVLITLQDLNVAFVEIAAFLNTGFASAIDFVIEKFRDLLVGVSGLAQSAGGLLGIEFLEEEAAALREWASTLEGTGKVAEENWTALLTTVRAEAEATKAAIEEDRQALIQNFLTGPPAGGSALVQELNNVAEAANQAGTEIDKLSAKEEKRLQRLAAQLERQTETPLETYIRELKELDEVYDRGLITLETYTRAQAQLAETLAESNESTKKVKDSTNETLEAIKRGIQGFGTEIEDVFVNLNTGVSVSFEELSKSVTASITRIITRLLIVDPLVKNLTASLQGLGSSGGGFLSLFGLGGAPLALPTSGGFVGSTGAAALTPGLVQPITGFLQSGGSATAREPYIVGESGPELFVPRVSGTVVPNGEFGGGVNVVNYFTIQAPAGTVSRETEQQIARATLSAAQRATARTD